MTFSCLGFRSKSKFDWSFIDLFASRDIQGNNLIFAPGQNTNFIRCVGWQTHKFLSTNNQVTKNCQTKACPHLSNGILIFSKQCMPNLWSLMIHLVKIKVWEQDSCVAWIRFPCLITTNRLKTLIFVRKTTFSQQSFESVSKKIPFLSPLSIFAVFYSCRKKIVAGCFYTNHPHHKDTAIWIFYFSTLVYNLQTVKNKPKFVLVFVKHLAR